MSEPTLFEDTSTRDDGTVEGEVKSLLYEDGTKPWRVVRLRTSHGDLVAVGRFAEVSIGDRLRVVGRYEDSERYGQRFVMESYLEVEPDTLEGLVRYLGGGRFAGIGEASAKRIVEAFGLETLQVLDHAPHRLASVSGLGKKKAVALETPGASSVTHASSSCSSSSTASAARSHDVFARSTASARAIASATNPTDSRATSRASASAPPTPSRGASASAPTRPSA